MVSITVHRRLLVKIAMILFLLILATVTSLFTFFGKAAPDDSVKLPILMYHSILRDDSRVSDYRITTTMLEEDLKYLKEHGYTTVVVEDLINYVTKDQPLPEKMVMLTFDDGFLNNLTDVYPLFLRYDMKGVVSPVGSYTEQSTLSNDPNPEYSYLTWDDLRFMSESGRFEIQNHSYNMHGTKGRHGALKKNGESTESYIKAFESDTRQMQNDLLEKSGIKATAYTYPLGAVSDESVQVIKNLGMPASFSCYEHWNKITKDPECLYRLGRYNRSGKYTTESFMKKVKLS